MHRMPRIDTSCIEKKELYELSVLEYANDLKKKGRYVRYVNAKDAKDA